jgi:Protein of unknown function (DUF642)/PEP-CTERM motif
MHRLSNQARGVLLASAMAMAPAVHANLLTNGSFESGGFLNQGNDTMSLAAGSTVITGWSVVTDTTAWIGPTNPFSLLASDGNYFLDLTNYQPGAPFAGMSQTIATQAGATYELSFDLGGSNRWGRPDSLTASAAGSSATFTTPTTGTVNDWYHHTLQFVAAGTSTTVVLQGSAGRNYIGLDHASVDLVSAPVPEPGSWAMLVSGLLAMALLRRRLD